MPKETFGGDDEGGGGVEERKKLPLSKFGLSPDANIRDVFWKIMASYAATKKPGVDLSTLENDRIALIRVAVSVLSSPHSGYYGMSPRFMVNYTLMMMLDAGWEDTFVEFLEEASESRSDLGRNVMLCLRKLASGQEGYAQKIRGYFAGMIRDRQTQAIALGYMAQIENPELAKALKKELIILARGDIGKNQLNAIKTISLLKNDDEVKKSLIILLSHWDREARLAAAEILRTMASDAEVKAAAKRKIPSESDGEIKKILETIAK